MRRTSSVAVAVAVAVKKVQKIKVFHVSQALRDQHQIQIQIPQIQI